MSPPRRRSSRLAAATPKASKATPELSSVSEHHEPVQTPRRSSKRSQQLEQSTPQAAPTTPASSALKPPHDEMHPSKCQASMAAPSSALRLGFSDIKASRHEQSGLPGCAQGTPTKIGRPPSSAFTFRFVRGAADMKLSENAQRLMDELREQANKIKADLVSQREAGGGIEFPALQPASEKKKQGRFSAAHEAEFKKMDSIENHASAWRATRTTPVKPNLKRSSSKAELDAATPTSARSNLKRSQAKPEAVSTPNTRPKSTLKRTASRADLDGDDAQSKKNDTASSATKPRGTPRNEPVSSFAKRIKKHVEDDASAARPVSRDDSSIPRPKSSGQGSTVSTQSQSSLSRLMSPTKSSRAHFGDQEKPTISLVKSPSFSNLKGTPQPATAAGTASPSRFADVRRRIISPGRFQKVKSILRKKSSEHSEGKSAIPGPAMLMSQTPAAPQVEKDLPAVPLTTPRRKLAKQVAFTPETKRAAECQDSPSPQKPLTFQARLAKKKAELQQDFSSIDEILVDSTASETSDVVYPDLSAFKTLTESADEKKAPKLPESVPGTFTFRSDHTISFGAASSTGFGASPGQSSVRQVRSSIAPKATSMPGSFPALPSPSTHPNKENRAPPPSNVILGAPHGMSNKKRHRATWDEEDAEKEAAERAAKKAKNEHVPEGQALLAPRLVGATPGSVKKTQVGRSVNKTPGSATPSKKRAGLSMSRLNMLARPKHRA
ncbi:unnamed protein product [Clonostachys rhizophaga]|uniref:Erythromycin esterase n=1 Tax=Clonostachys rhizophaga TaxID=160324 RepID=A0A9N9VV00_9HYPO|nr:unnamed protein product [Clonostachys rhizophaga]